MRKYLLLALVTLAGLVPAGSANAAGPLQPGDFIGTSVGGCTLGFAFRGTGGLAGKTYFVTAAHCVNAVGETVEDLDGDAFARVALRGNPDVSAQDYAFLEVFAADVARVNPAMLGHPNAPTGYTRASETATLDQIHVSGYGVGFDLTPATRQSRTGFLVSDTAAEYTAIAMDVNGDSGGPFIHGPTDKAFGLVSRLCLGLCTSEGPTVEGILAKAAARGFTVALMTV